MTLKDMLGKRFLAKTAWGSVFEAQCLELSPSGKYARLCSGWTDVEDFDWQNTIVEVLPDQPEEPETEDNPDSYDHTLKPGDWCAFTDDENAHNNCEETHFGILRTRNSGKWIQFVDYADMHWQYARKLTPEELKEHGLGEES